MYAMNNTTNIGFQSVNCLIVAICESLVAAISTVTNGLLLVVLYKNPFKSFRRPFSMLIIGLAATDFLKGFLADSISAWVYYQCALGKKSWLEEGWNFFTVFDYTLDNSATLLVVLFSGDRLLAITGPLFYRNYVTAKKISIVVLSVWVYAFFFSLLQFTGIKEESYDLLDSFLHIVLPMILMITIHASIFCVLKKRRKVETSAYSASNENTPRWIRKNQQLEKNFRYVAGVITLVLAISQLPWLSLVIIEMSCDGWKGLEWHRNYYLFAGFLLSITSAINPVLYCWRLKEYRRAMAALVTCTKMQRTASSLGSVHNGDSVDLHANSQHKDSSK